MSNICMNNNFGLSIICVADCESTIYLHSHRDATNETAMSSFDMSRLSGRLLLLVARSGT